MTTLRMRALAVTRAVLALALLAAVMTSAPPARGQADDPVAQSEIAEIRRAFDGLGLRAAGVTLGADGRIALTGEYEDREQVEMAFAAARAVVGLRRLAPTTPANIKYRLKGFDTAFASTVGKMMQKSARPAVPEAPARAMPSAPAAAVPPPAPATATATLPAADRGRRTYGLIVGVGKFRNLPEANQLEFADKDAADFHAFLVSPQGGALAREHIVLLRQQEATSRAVKNAMREIVQNARAGDTVVFFAASHGLPNAMGKFDVVLHDTEFPRKKAGPSSQSLDFTITNRETALADDDIQGFVSQLALHDVRTVLVLDTCYSGKTFVAIPGYLPSRTRSLTRHKKEVEYSASLSQEQLNEFAQKAATARATRIVIVSASENEESMESPKSNGGLFTQTYIGALAKVRDYADAFDQAKPSVIRSARTVGHSQTPRLLAVPESAETKL
jgi:hypothetical protein